MQIKVEKRKVKDFKNKEKKAEKYLRIRITE